MVACWASLALSPTYATQSKLRRCAVVGYGGFVRHNLFATKNKPPEPLGAGGLQDKSLTMTYFHRRPSTIIGAKAFHCPVRDGKEWCHLAMVIRRSLLTGGHCPRQSNLGRSMQYTVSVRCQLDVFCMGCVVSLLTAQTVNEFCLLRHLLYKPRSLTDRVIGSSRTGN